MCWSGAGLVPVLPDYRNSFVHPIQRSRVETEIWIEKFAKKDPDSIYTAPTGICCDNYDPLLTKRTPVVSWPGSPAPDTEDTPSEAPDGNGKRGMNTAASVSDRRDDHLKGARKRLEHWRYNTWTELYIKRPWGFQPLMLDKVLTALATKAQFSTVDDLTTGGWSPTHARKHGSPVLALLQEYDTLFREFNEAEKEERARLRKEETAAN
ncbi:hypothetical protein DFH07DRAFT_769500 [Mycena maculata]|uniref:Uncharacterized protein n=1 Tax=Mycena maculata TaxID=230809 RepID=A0AAD7JQI7_9AGAR|nr:hypothetical protein DFH07DRAFT_769500 [Mycena maculata]